MSVGIAALCDNGTGCVLATDQTITARLSSDYEFESQEMGKIVPMTDSIYALISGNVVFAAEILESAKAQLKFPRDVKALSETVRKSYQEVRRQQVIRTELEPRGIDLNSYYQLQQRLLPGIVQSIDQALTHHSLKTDIMIAGQDELGCHIFTIQHPGDMICNTTIGFGAIGSGGSHSIYYFLESSYRKSMTNQEVEDLVRKAKTRAEIAPGVGTGTHLVSIKGLSSEVLH